MKMRLLAPGFLLLLMACEIDHGLGTLESQITGHVIFRNRDLKPERIDAVRVVAVIHFPPQSLGDLVFTNTSINLSQERPAYYLPAPLARYSVVGAVYREKGKEWDYSKILGFYGTNPDSNIYAIAPVTLSKAHPVARDIDIYCDWAMVPRGRQEGLEAPAALAAAEAAGAAGVPRREMDGVEAAAPQRLSAGGNVRVAQTPGGRP